MAACAMAEETESPQQPAVREPRELGWRQVDDLLKHWGSARWRVGLCGGFPEQSAIASRVELYEPREWFQVKQITATGRQRPHFGGHRILYDAAWQPSRRLLMVNAAVNALPEAQFRAIVVSYAVGYVSTEDFSQKQLAEMLDISQDALSERLRRARKKLARTLAIATGWV